MTNPSNPLTMDSRKETEQINSEDLFLEIQQSKMQVTGFWDEGTLSSLIKQTELLFKTEIIKTWFITDIVIHGDKALLKWNKRLFPLSDSELKEKYGR